MKNAIGFGGLAYRRWIFLLWAAVVALGATSCAPEQVFHSKDYEKIYKAGRKQGLTVIRRLPIEDSLQYYRYRVLPGDELRVRFLNLPPELAEGSFGIEADAKYIVNIDGMVAVPLVGRLRARDRTTDQLEDTLTQMYAQYFPAPNIDVSVANLKVHVYGEAANQGVILLPTERTHLVEALAIAGGVPRTARADKVKIIRGHLRNPQIIWVDLRKVEGLSQDDLYMRSGDIIFLETRPMQAFVRELQPYATTINIITILPSLYLLFERVRY